MREVATEGDRRPPLLVFVRHYLPGYKAGGAIKSLSNMVEVFGDEFNFRIVTADRDVDDTEAYPAVPVNRWTKVGKADVYYVARGSFPALRTIGLLRHTRHGLVYLNSFFDRGFSMWPLLLWRLGVTQAPLLLAPRGEFSPGALAIKGTRKHAFLWLARELALYRGVRWHLSTALEDRDLHAALGGAFEPQLAAGLPEGCWRRRSPYAAAGASRFVAEDLTLEGPKDEASRRSALKKPGTLKIVFVSRIARKKNLSYVLSVLKGASGQIRLDIYGPLEDGLYWRECQAQIASLAENVTARYHGPIRPQQVGGVFREAELFFFPTLGENFGHVVTEALAEGCPVLLSDQTPWTGVQEAGAGWALPLANKAAFLQAVQHCVGLDPTGFEALAVGAFKYARRVASSSASVIERNRAMLQELVRGYVPESKR